MRDGERTDLQDQTGFSTSAVRYSRNKYKIKISFFKKE
jgi:hypothetical protein